MMLLSATDVLPINSEVVSYLERSGNGPIHALARAILHLPYLERIAAAMQSTGYGETDIHAKLDTVTATYVILALAYGAVAIVVVAALLVWGPRSDFRGRIQVSVSRRWVSGWLGFILAPLVVFDLMFLWFGIHGFGDFPEEDPTLPFDYIITNKYYICINIVLIAMSLSFTLLIFKIVQNYVYWSFRSRRTSS
jgi:hypothetical protein